MKVLLINTFGSYGGAAKATIRLKDALEKQGVHVSMLWLLEGNTYQSSGHRKGLVEKILDRARFILERLQVLFMIRERKNLYKFSTGSFGKTIAGTREFKNADVIHLHWVNFGFLSINGIAKIAGLKPMVWTLHDMWAFTGGCHYSLQCANFEQQCKDCFYLKTNSLAAHKLLVSKREQWKKEKLNLIACSTWLGRAASRSTLFDASIVKVIGNTLDFEVFRPRNKKQMRLKYGLPANGYFLLFGAADQADERKGANYLARALDHVNGKIAGLQLITFGSSSREFKNVTNFGSINDEFLLSEIYNIADVFILPSIQDNLPNTVMEALSCGVPVVSFDSGGVTDMVEHLKNGYIAANMDSVDLAQGIRYFADSNICEAASIDARLSIMSKYSNEIIAQKHIDLYGKVIQDI